MESLVAWLIFLFGVICFIAGVECIELFIRRRWHSNVRLPDPVAYTDSPSFPADASIILRVHSSQATHIRFNRCGASGYVQVHETRGPATTQTRSMHRWEGFDWQPTITLPPYTLSPGLYFIEISHANTPAVRWCMNIVVSPPAATAAMPAPPHTPIVVVASTNTWNAYNDFGGLSNYTDHATPPPLNFFRAILMYFSVRLRVGDRHWLLAVPLPERRPNLAIHNEHTDPNRPLHLARAESALIRFLESENVAYSIISDRDFAFSLPVDSTRLLIFNTHSEYWSEEMLARLAEFICRGVSVAFLSGNNIYRKVQFLRDAISVIARMTPPAEIAPLIGTYYDAAGYLTYDSYRVLDPDHWSFAGTNAHEGTEFGAATDKHPAASGYETDKIRLAVSPSSPVVTDPAALGFRTLAVGKNPEGPAFMVCRDLPNGAFVFSTGSVAFAPCVEDDPAIQNVVRNLLRRALQANSNSTDAAKDR